MSTMKASNVTPAGTTSDNSSDNSMTNIKKKSGGGDGGTGGSTKSEIEIVDQKIIKCINEINFLKQKMQSKFCFFARKTPLSKILPICESLKSPFDLIS